MNKNYDNLGKMPKNEKDIKIPMFDKELDLSNARRGVWLVKVPKYIAQKWDKAPSNMDVGKLRIAKRPGQKTQVSLSLTPSLLATDPEDKIPAEHMLDVTQVAKQTLGVFSHNIGVSNIQMENHSSNSISPMDNDEQQLFMEGRIVQKLECRPSIADKCYLQLKLDAIHKASQTQRCVQRLDKVVQNFKPIKDHAHNIEYLNRKKMDGMKFRENKIFVMDILFKAFENHQYYNITDLVKITNQHVTYLKEILKNVCDFNMQNPHKNMWELKKEYRHYKTQEKDKK